MKLYRRVHTTRPSLGGRPACAERARSLNSLNSAKGKRAAREQAWARRLLPAGIVRLTELFLRAYCTLVYCTGSR